MRTRSQPSSARTQSILAAADLHRAGVADLPGLDRLTAFADNLVPHVPRVDSTLWNRGREARYKSFPRLRSRNRAY
jgi:hypothetical protein